MTRADRNALYREALETYGITAQSVVAVEEMSEVQKEICKTIRGQGCKAHLAEEIADARIMLEQMEEFFGLYDMVADSVEFKLSRLRERIEKKRKEPEL